MGEEEPAVITHQPESASLAGRDPSTSLTHFRKSDGHFFLVYARNAVCQYMHIVSFVQEVQGGLQHANVGLGDRGSITNSIEAPGAEPRKRTSIPRITTDSNLRSLRMASTGGMIIEKRVLSNVPRRNEPRSLRLSSGTVDPSPIVP